MQIFQLRLEHQQVGRQHGVVDVQNCPQTFRQPEGSRNYAACIAAPDNLDAERSRTKWGVKWTLCGSHVRSDAVRQPGCARDRSKTGNRAISRFFGQKCLAPEYQITKSAQKWMAACKPTKYGWRRACLYKPIAGSRSALPTRTYWTYSVAATPQPPSSFSARARSLTPGRPKLEGDATDLERARVCARRARSWLWAWCAECSRHAGHARIAQRARELEIGRDQL